MCADTNALYLYALLYGVSRRDHAQVVALNQSFTTPNHHQMASACNHHSGISPGYNPTPSGDYPIKQLTVYVPIRYMDHLTRQAKE